MSWPKAKLGECATLINGRAYKQDELLESGTPVLRIQNLNGGDRWYYSDLSLAQDKYCEKGDLLFAWSASFGPYLWNGPKAIYHYHIWKVIPGNHLDKLFLHYLLGHLTDRVKSESHGASMLHMTKSRMEALEIPLPPLEEQRRIAAILGKASRLTAVQQKRAGLLGQIEASLFDQIAAESAHESQGRKLKELTADDDKINYGVVQPGNQFDGGIPLIRAGDISHGRVNRTELKCIDPAIEASYGRSRIKGNEILISCVGSIGAVATVEPSDIGSNIARAVARVPVSDSVNKKWLAACLRSAAVQHYFVNELRTVSQPTLNIKQIEETNIQLPPIEFQMAFALKLEAIENVLARSSASEAKTSSIISAIESMTFSGHF